MLHSGIDLHKRDLVIATVDAAGTPIAEAKLPTSRAAVQSYFAKLPGPHRAVVESTATWYWLRDLLVDAGIDLRLGHCKYIKAITYAKVKTDAVDAATLAQLHREPAMVCGRPSRPTSRRRGRSLPSFRNVTHCVTVYSSVLLRGNSLMALDGRDRMLRSCALVKFVD